MNRAKKRDTTSPTPRVPKLQPAGASILCTILYEVALLVAATLLLLAPIHQIVTRHCQIERVVDPTHVLIGKDVDVSPGERSPVFRFHNDWKSPIGEVSVESRSPEGTLLQFDPAAFRWPMGRHGIITRVADGGIEVNLGQNLNLVPGDTLIVFREREQVGRILLTAVAADSAKAQWIDGAGPAIPGLQVSEFLVPTQVVVFRNPLVSLLEVVLPCLVLGAYVVGWWRLRRSPFPALGPSLILALKRPWVPLLFQALVGVPIVWLVVRFAALAVPYLLRSALAEVALRLHFDPGNTFDGLRSLGEYLDRLSIPIAAIALLWYGYVLVYRKTSPVGLAWNLVRFKGGPLRQVKPGFVRDAITWLLHLVIAYFFAYSLSQFLGANLNAALALSWPGSSAHVIGRFDPTDLRGTLDFIRSMAGSVGYMLTHTPIRTDVESGFATVRYLLWSLTIVGCLVGYGHSILGYLWGKRIRNLDFTPMGWVTNAVCYGPLLGVVVWQLVPPLMGRDPIFGTGTLLHLDLAGELFLDVLYTLTIWNLGTMFGVMTDKGVRTTGFYSVVRHPSYTLEALMFVLLELRGLSSGGQWVAVSMFLFCYWIRSEREDEFMSRSNPEYGEYKVATPYKFIRGIY